MKIHLVTHTPQPEKAIAAAFWNMGIGHDVTSLDDITDAKAGEAISEIFKSHLDAPLENASFNFFWQGIPVFMRAHLVRHRVGWGYAERSLRFRDAGMKEKVVEEYDWDAMPTVKDEPGNGSTPLIGQSLRGLYAGEMKRQMKFYELLVREGVATEDARNVIGVWYPTDLQTTCTYRALRGTLAARLSSQAHPYWRQAANQIKDLVTKVSPLLGAGLVDICQLSGRCVWNSRYDRDCEDCVRRSGKARHTHEWTLDTSFGEKTQCTCGQMKVNLLT